MVYGADALLLGSTGLKIAIDPAVGYTTVAGLRFQDEATIDLAQDGVVEVSRTGVRASDADGGKYVSREVSAGSGKRIAMVRTGSQASPAGAARVHQDADNGSPPIKKTTATESGTVYRYTPSRKATGSSRDLKVTRNQDGTTTATGLVDGASLAVADGSPPDRPVLVIDARGSTNLQVSVNPSVGFVELAGLRFRTNVRVDIWEDGIVQVNREGLRVEGVDDKWYISRKRTIGGRNAVVMVESNSGTGTRLPSSKSPTRNKDRNDSGKTSPAIENLIEEIHNARGTIVRDEDSPSKPVVSVGLSGPNVTNDGVARLKVFTQLQTLELFACWNVTDAGLVHLKEFKQLRTLEFSCSKITDAGLVHLKGLTQLRRLKLSSENVTGPGLVYLKGLPQLQTLDLFGTPVTDAGLVYLKGFNQLLNLNLFGTEVTVAGVVELQKALPNVEIHLPNVQIQR